MRGETKGCWIYEPGSFVRWHCHKKFSKKFVSFTTSLHIMRPYLFRFFSAFCPKTRFFSAFFPSFFPAYHDHGLATKNRVVPSRTPTAICRLGGRAASRLLGVLAVPFRVPVVVVRGMTAVEALLLTSELHHHVSKI